MTTVGTEPQVVTLTCDILEVRGFGIERVLVVHPNPAAPLLRESLGKIKQEAECYYAQKKPPLVFSFVPIRDGGYYPEDFIKQEDVAVLLRVLYRTVAELKRRGYRVHLSIAGGRKVMAAMGMVVAQLLLDEKDCVWHLLSEGKLVSEKSMHPQSPEQVALVPVPVLQWNLFPSTVREILLWDDPYRAIEKQRELRQRERLSMIQGFWERLTPMEQEVTRALIRFGGTQKELAQYLRRSVKTINNQLCSVYDKYREHFGMEEKTRVRDRVIADLSILLENMGSSP